MIGAFVIAQIHFYLYKPVPSILSHILDPFHQRLNRSATSSIVLMLLHLPHLPKNLHISFIQKYPLLSAPSNVAHRNLGSQVLDPLFTPKIAQETFLKEDGNIVTFTDDCGLRGGGGRRTSLLPLRGGCLVAVDRS